MGIHISSLIFIGLLYSQNYPEFEVVQMANPNPSPIFLYTMSEEDRFMAILDSNLNVQWHVHSNHMGLDFKVNQDLLSYYDRLDGSWILLDSLMKEVDTLRCEGSYIADYHDIQVLENGHYILEAYDSIFVDMSAIIDGGQSVAWITGILIIQEFNSNDELIFEWNAWEHLSIADYTNLNLEADAIEWMHCNSIEVDGDEHILISNRASNEILKINRQSGDIVWHLGGPLNEFTFINDPKHGFKMQHDVRRLDNGNITLFDNGVTHSPPISRVLEYGLDENEKTAELVWDYIHPDSIIGLAMGSVQRLPNGNTLINWGTINNRGALITEVTNDKNIVLEIQYPDQHKVYKVRKDNWSFAVNLLAGDINLDNTIDILDINYIIDHYDLMSVPLDIYHLFRYDTDKDGEININDIEFLVDQILFQDQ